MTSYIWFELKRKIKNPKTWFLVVLILIISLQRIDYYKVKSLKMSTYDEYNSIGMAYESIGSTALYDKMLSEEDRESYKLLIDTGINIKNAAEKEDYIECNRLVSFGSLVIGKSSAKTEGKLKQNDYNIKAMKIWDDVSDGIDYEEVNFKYGNIHARKDDCDSAIIRAKYYGDLYKRDLFSIDRHYIDSMTFLYHYLNDIVPIVIGFIVLILIFDNINDEWSNGSLKLILTQPLSRNKYIISKIIVGVLYTLFILLVPALVISTGFGTIDGFKNYNYPVLYLEDSFQTTKILFNNLKGDFDWHGVNFSLGISIHSTMPYGPDISKRLELIPLYKFILLSLLLLTLCIIFYVTLNLFISSMTKNKIIAFTISGLITLIGTIYSQQWVIDDKYNLSPFTMNNPVRILNGTYNVTALTATIILLGTSLLIFICNSLYYGKKDL